MRSLSVFNNVSVDGYYCDADGRMDWAHEGSDEPEFAAWTASNASGDGALLLGRTTYEMMASFWPTPEAGQMMPDVAHGMNAMPKYVASKTMTEAAWANTTVLPMLINGVADLKVNGAHDLTILGSGSLVAPLMRAKMIDEVQLVVCPLVLGGGKSLLAGFGQRSLELIEQRAFANGKVFLRYGVRYG
jgi:dihydrofolate reductase